MKNNEYITVKKNDIMSKGHENSEDLFYNAI